MVGYTSRHGSKSTDRHRHDRISRPERLEDGGSVPLNPVAAWSIVLLASVALWGGLGLAISSVVRALL